jgi:hypothetical protein
LESAAGKSRLAAILRFVLVVVLVIDLFEKEREDDDEDENETVFRSFRTPFEASDIAIPGTQNQLSWK